MTRAFTLLSILLALGACAATSWLAIRPPLAPFLAQAAPDIQVVNWSIWEWQVSYHVPGPPYAWYWAVTHSLQEQQWTLRTGYGPDLAGPSYNPIFPVWFERTSFGLLVDEIVVDPDRRNPNLARMRVSRRIIIPWRQFLECP